MLGFAVLWCCAGAAAASPRTSERSGSSRELKIGSIRAYLYHHELGKLDDRDILGGKVALRNVFIGEGDALTPASAVLVVVDLEGASLAGSTAASPVLRVGARQEKRELGDIRVRVSDFFSSRRRISVPTLVYGVTCGDLEITARIDGLPRETVVKAVAPFTCGE